MIVSKVGARPATGPVPLALAQRPAELRAAVERDLTELGVERIAVANLRRADIGPGLVATGDQVVDLDDQLAEMIALRDEGKIAAIGMSNIDLDTARRAAPAGIVCIQNAYNLLNRTGADVLEFARQQDIAFVPYFPLGSAFLGSPRCPRTRWCARSPPRRAPRRPRSAWRGCWPTHPTSCSSQAPRRSITWSRTCAAAISG